MPFSQYSREWGVIKTDSTQPLLNFLNLRDMETAVPGSQAKPVVTQLETNTTQWIGHMGSDPRTKIAGQTFECPASGTLDNIQVFASAVQAPGQVEMTLHEFDSSTKTWGPAISESKLPVERNQSDRWIRFRLPSVNLRQGTEYAFRIKTEDGFIALGEAAAGNKEPFTFGREWNGDNADRNGRYFSYFSLAFKVEMRA